MELNDTLSRILPGEDYLIYDFSLEVGDTFTTNYPGFDPTTFNLVVIESDSITLLDNTKRKRLTLGCDFDPENWKTYWIEGIGSTRGFRQVPFSCVFDVNNHLVCYSENETLLYDSPSFNECWLTTSTAELSNLNLEFIPNPTNGSIQIMGYQGNIQYKVFSKIGSTLLRGQSDNQAIDLSEYPAGLYFIEVIVDEGREVFKVVKN